MKNNLFIGKEAREKIVVGIKKCSLAIGGTMGAAGYNAVIECMESPGHFSTNDGATILEAIRFEEPLEDLGRRILLEAVKRANTQSGDGSSTTTVLCAAIIEEGLRFTDEYTPMDIKRSLEECVPIIEESIHSQSKSISVNEVGQVASIAAEDEKIGAMIQEIYQKIGADGIIHQDISKSFEDNYTIGKGITIDGAGFASPYMADLDEKTGGILNVARWKDARVLLVRQKITTAADFNGLFQSLFDRDIKEVVVFCDEYEPNIITDLILTRVKRGFKTLLIKMPTLWKDWWYEDIAKATGATIIDPNAGISLRTMSVDHLGRVEHITVSKDATYLDGLKDMSGYIKELEEKGDDDSKLRASRLNLKTARYFVGAPSDSALAYRRLKVEDAIHSAYYSLKHGVVAGGGSALASVILPNTIGGDILRVALFQPAKQISLNAGFELRLASDYLDGRGFDTRTKQFVNMFEAGIVDSTDVTLNAVRNAISVAAAILTAPVVVLLPKQNPVESFVEYLSQRNSIPTL